MSRWWLVGGVATVLCLAWLGRAQSPVKEAWFEIHQVRFDESVAKKTLPRIPKGWKFIAAEHGEVANETFLWFQDEAGSLYMIRGVKESRGNEFWVKEYVNQIEAEK